MGSRTTWKITTEDYMGIHLYSHWGGEDKLSLTAKAIQKAEPRWEDLTYFTRIFTSCIIGDNWDSETGYGLWSGLIGKDFFEESYEPVTIYPKEQLIRWDSELFTYREFLEFANNTLSIMSEPSDKV